MFRKLILKKMRRLLLCLVIVFVTISSCKKDGKEVFELDNSTTSSKDNSEAENIFSDMKKIVEEAADDEGKSGKKAGYTFGSCAIVSISPAWSDSTIWPKIMTIDFGTANCTGNNGVYRRGKLLVTLTDRFRDLGSVLTVQPQNYYANDVKVEGTKTLTSNGYNSNNNLSYSVNVSNAVLTFTDNSSMTWQSSRTSEWIEGDSTDLFNDGVAGICDDVYSITGSGSGVNRNGLSYSVVITSPLRKEVCCRWLVSGSLDISPQGLSTRLVDYGTGACNRFATVTINGNAYNVSMW
jgi:hypothetical protein